MNKFNTQLHIEETDHYRIGELMNEVNTIRYIEAKRCTKQIDTHVIYEVVSNEDYHGYYKVQEPLCIGGHIHYIHKSNMKEVEMA